MRDSKGRFLKGHRTRRVGKPLSKEEIKRRTATRRKNGWYTLHTHHIDYNKKNNHPSNLISLCRNCHPQTNFSKEDWTNYFQNRRKGLT